ncbi:MAG: cardiolipin synthase [Marinilabiliales bacterium]|nr:cardiolipin synthase [Marinilabiliales bacterium]
MTLLNTLLLVYLLLLGATCVEIIVHTRNAQKAMTYLLLVFFIPVIGILFYLLVGGTFRKASYDRRKRDLEERIRQQVPFRGIAEAALEAKEEPELISGISQLLRDGGMNPVTRDNEVLVLRNGEEKIPELIRSISRAKHHIHLEYYILDNDSTGKSILEALKDKVAEGVKVRMICDGYGCYRGKNGLIREMKKAGIEVAFFNRLGIYGFTRRLNYRNHRKTVIIDGHTGFMGGINLSDRYINTSEREPSCYWRDTHLKLIGSAVKYLQYLFLCDWNHCSPTPLMPDIHFFPSIAHLEKGKVLQFAASGPDSPAPTILYAFLWQIANAHHEILLTTPYLIPCESLMHALEIAARAGVRVQILIPADQPKFAVRHASRYPIEFLLKAGASIYQYNKGYIHAKTDGKIATLGTANFDDRSLFINFEVNAILADDQIAAELRRHFFEDLKNATPIDPASWEKRSLRNKILENCARLLSPLL